MKHRALSIMVSLAMSVSLLSGEVMLVSAEEVQEQSEDVAMKGEFEQNGSDSVIGEIAQNIGDEEFINPNLDLPQTDLKTEASGSCGMNTSYTFDSATGLLTIFGSGTMNMGAFNCHTDIKSVVINEGITEIMDNAFFGCSGLTSVTIPNGVTLIRTNAFSKCTGLTSITIPNGVTRISTLAFEGCTGLTSVTIPDGVTSIGSYAFYGCYSLKSITVPNSVTSIEDFAFGRYDIMPNLTCYGYTKSAAESYCKNYGITFVPLDKVALSSQTISIENDAYSYTGSSICPKVTINGLTEGTDFSVSYADNINVGTGTVTITGMGKYTGTVTKIFTINASPTPEPASEDKKDDDSWKDSDTGFRDVPHRKYYEDPVKWAVSKKVTTGTSSTTFSPDEACSRAQVVTFLWRAYGSPEPNLSFSIFDDVQDSSKYYYKAVLWALENHVTTGVTEKEFAPNDTVTRGQFVTFLYRAAGKPAVSGSCKFTDVESGKFYYTPIIWAAATGVTTGTSETTFSPNDPCTRGQVVTFIYRAMQ